jgi:AraC-like DNA-binding protein
MATEFDLNLRSYKTASESHAHAHHQAIFPLRGAMDLETELGHHRIAPRSVAVMTPGQTHAFAGRDRNLFLIVDIVEGPTPLLSALWDAASERDLFELDVSAHHLTSFAARQPDVLQRSAGARESLARLLIQGLAVQLGALDKEEPQTLLRARRFMGANLAAPIGLSTIADAAGCSVSKLTRRFRDWHGMSPGRYLARLRLQQAEALITESRLPLAEIALACGFSEQSAMTRAMTRAGMTTPARLRQAAWTAQQVPARKPS